jgi:hypothetical protein
MTEPAERFEEHRSRLRAIVYRFTTSAQGITAIELVADPDRIEQLDLVVSP